jgi:hypothetical protein
MKQQRRFHSFWNTARGQVKEMEEEDEDGRWKMDMKIMIKDEDER